MLENCDGVISRTAVIKSIKTRVDIINRWANNEDFFPLGIESLSKEDLNKFSLALGEMVDYIYLERI